MLPIIILVITELTRGRRDVMERVIVQVQQITNQVPLTLGFILGTINYGGS